MENWRQFIAETVPVHGLSPGITWADITLAEERLGIGFPTELKTLLRETNGVRFLEYEFHLIWPLEMIVAENLRIRSDEGLRASKMPLDCLFFFSEAGNGDLFAQAIINGEVPYPDVFTWNHEDDSRYVVATSLQEFIRGWSNGSIKL